NNSVNSYQIPTSDTPVCAYTKDQLWKLFISKFELLHGKKIKITDQFIENIKPIFLYFLKDQDFFKCKNLRDDITTPSFNKGFLIMGGYGVGKTDFFKVFENIF